MRRLGLKVTGTTQLLILKKSTKAIASSPMTLLAQPHLSLVERLECRSCTRTYIKCNYFNNVFLVIQSKIARESARFFINDFSEESIWFLPLLCLAGVVFYKTSIEHLSHSPLRVLDNFVLSGSK